MLYLALTGFGAYCAGSMFALLKLVGHPATKDSVLIETHRTFR